MDRKGFIIIGLSVALMFLWPKLVYQIYPPKPVTSTNTLAVATNRVPGADRPEMISQRLTNALTTVLPSVQPAIASGPEQTEVLENEDQRLTFTSRGGGLKVAELKRYKATVDCRNATGEETNRLAALNAGAPRAALSLAGPVDLVGDGEYSMVKAGGVMRFQKQLPTGLHIIKEFRLGTNYLLAATVRFENRTNQPVVVAGHELLIGASTPMSRHDESLTMGLEWYDGSDAAKIDDAWFANRTLGCIPGTPRDEYRQGSSNVVWAAVHNQFFTIIATPAVGAPQVVGRKVELPAPSAAESAADRRVVTKPHGQEAAFAYPQTVLAAGESMEHAYDLYIGPKDYYTLSRQPNDLDLVMGFNGWFGPFAKGLLLSMNALHAFVPSYGFTIIFITVIIKLLFWPLTNASTRSMKRMAELQPQMKALQEKYKDDPKKMNVKLMEYMKENKVSPLGGCLPMLLQIPVFIGFYQMLQSAIELRGAEFLWVCDLSQSDTIAMIPGVNFPINPMPIMMGVTMFFQARLTPPSPGMDPVQQKIMKYMPMMFVVFLYNFSAGLTLYWTVQNLLTIAQMKLTKTKPKDAGGPGRALPASARPTAPRKKGA